MQVGHSIVAVEVEAAAARGLDLGQGSDRRGAVSRERLKVQRCGHSAAI